MMSKSGDINMTLGIIYLLTNTINGKQYVGQTVDLNRRLAEHKRKTKQVVEKAIDKYGWNSFEVEILEDNVPSNRLDAKEIKYIERYNTFNEKGYNQTEGGDGWDEGRERCEETKAKISEGNKGKHLSEKTKKRISENHADLSGENHPMYGEYLTEKTKEKISKANKGINNPSAKISKNMGIEIKEKYEASEDLLQKDLAEKYDISKTTVGRIVRGKHWTTREDDNGRQENGPR